MGLRILAGPCFANKLTVLLRVSRNGLTPHLYRHPVNTKHLYDFIQCWTNVEDVGPTLYKCFTNVLCLLGRRTFSKKHCTFFQCWFNVGPFWESDCHVAILELGWFGPPTTHLTTHKQHIWAFNWWLNEALCFSYCLILKLKSTERSFKSWNDILSHKFFYMPHGFPFFRPPVMSCRLTESLA